MENNEGNRYTFTLYFYKVFRERTGLELTEDNRAYILGFCSTTVPHKKIDDKGRYSEYFTMRLNEELITVVCDANTHKIITCIMETHHRKAFGNT